MSTIEQRSEFTAKVKFSELPNTHRRKAIIEWEFDSRWPDGEALYRMLTLTTGALDEHFGQYIPQLEDNANFRKQTAK